MRIWSVVGLIVAVALQCPSASSKSHPTFAASLQKRLTAELQSQHVPGALVYVSYPKFGTWAVALGNRDLNGNRLNVHSHMRIGSVTKTFTATAVLIAADKGLIGLDNSIEAYLPGVVPDGEGITVRDLLNMTSGLFNNTEDDDFNAELDRNPFQVFSVEHSLAVAFDHPRYFKKSSAACQGRQCWHYSNTNYLVLGLLLEKRTHRSLPGLFEEWIFAPLGMKETIMPELSSAELPRPYSRGFLFGTNVQSNEAYKAALRGDSAGSKIGVPPDQPPTDATDWNPSYTWAAGSAISTISDMVIWAKALGTGALLSPEMHKQQLTPAPYADYGLGISLGVLPGFVGHNGAIPGFQSAVAYSPETDVTIVVLTNSEVAPNRPLVDALPAENLAKLIAKYFSAHGREPK